MSIHSFLVSHGKTRVRHFRGSRDQPGPPKHRHCNPTINRRPLNPQTERRTWKWKSEQNNNSLIYKNVLCIYIIKHRKFKTKIYILYLIKLSIIYWVIELTTKFETIIFNDIRQTKKKLCRECDCDWARLWISKGNTDS